MTHSDAVKRSEGLLSTLADCRHQLTALGPAGPGLEQCALWICSSCRVALAIDPLGVIRDTRPLRAQDVRRTHLARDRKLQADRGEPGGPGPAPAAGG